MSNMRTHTQVVKGFTLIELSIVLVIIALVAGGVLVGRNLIETASIRSEIRQTERFSTATHAFRLKYHALPGDLSNPATYGLTAYSSCVSPEMCGNGDGLIQSTTTDPGYVGSGGEMIMFWRHLSDAGLVSGNYDGLHEIFYAQARTVGSSFPRSQVQGAYGVAVYAIDSANHFRIGAMDIPGNNFNGPYGDPYTAAQAFNIDTKIDDGRPYSGGVIVRYAGVTPEVESTVSTRCTDLVGNSQSNREAAVYSTAIADSYCGLRIVILK